MKYQWKTQSIDRITLLKDYPSGYEMSVRLVNQFGRTYGVCIYVSAEYGVMTVSASHVDLTEGIPIYSSINKFIHKAWKRAAAKNLTMHSISSGFIISTLLSKDFLRDTQVYDDLITHTKEVEYIEFEKSLRRENCKAEIQRQENV